jgi:ElaA protein
LSAVATQGLRWRCLPFADLGAADLYRVLQLRSAVFVVEQACVFQDMDGRDPACLHLLGAVPDAGEGSDLLAYARLVPPGLAFLEASIGRVATAAQVRGTRAGHALMAEAIAQVERLWGPQPIRIGAQAHLQAFYRQHGFEPAVDFYLEDGIEHIEMLRS